MAVNQAGIADTDGIQLTENSVVFAAGAGTLDSSFVVQVNWNDAVFTSAPEGKQRLVAALDLLKERIQMAKLWPVTSAS
ncbi:MAG: hypothetical protein ACREA9_01230 [Pyrinomonadaceae bacterium]